MSVSLKRAYEPPARSDGTRILVERLWPRGLSKQDAKIALWAREAAPSTGLRRWFNHEPAKWSEFKRRYFAELDGRREALESLREHLSAGPVTFVFASREPRFNNAVALKEYLERRRPRRRVVVLKRPASCDRAELAAFEVLVHESGEVLEHGLASRIRGAARLAFYYSPRGDLAAIAALKVPRKSYRDRVFRAARTRRNPDAYRLELGWFYVRPAHRGRRMSARLAAPLLEDEPDRAIFATTRADNSAMLKVLASLGFERTGAPYPRNSAEPTEMLVLLVRRPSR